ncbi:MAG: hypothetical protein H6574_20725 [Lewinellaceae bacterium]|nr:hypothetical protein [Lewinellaceae bacterium]
MIKSLYIGLLVIYILSFVGCIYRASIANKILNVSPEAIEYGSMDFEERKKIKQTYKLRKQITVGLIVTSVVVCLCSLIVWKLTLFYPIQIPKFVFIISGVIALTFIIANGIGFIPNPPIR